MTETRKEHWGPHRLGMLSAEKDALLGIIPEIFEKIDLLQISRVDLNKPFLEAIKAATEWLFVNLPRIIETRCFELFKTKYPGPTTLAQIKKLKRKDLAEQRRQWYGFQVEDELITREVTIDIMHQVFREFKKHAPQMPKWRKNTRTIMLPQSKEEITLHELATRFYRGLFEVLRLAIPDITDEELQTICDNPRITAERLERYLSGIEGGESLTTTRISQRAVAPTIDGTRTDISSGPFAPVETPT